MRNRQAIRRTIPQRVPRLQPPMHDVHRNPKIRSTKIRANNKTRRAGRNNQTIVRKHPTKMERANGRKKRTRPLLRIMEVALSLSRMQQNPLGTHALFEPKMPRKKNMTLPPREHFLMEDNVFSATATFPIGKGERLDLWKVFEILKQHNFDCTYDDLFRGFAVRVKVQQPRARISIFQSGKLKVYYFSESSKEEIEYLLPSIWNTLKQQEAVVKP